MSQVVKWGLIGTGAIARAFAHGVSQSQNNQIVAVGSRSHDKARAFADEHGIDTAHGSYDDLLGDDQVQAVYVSTPHPMHPRWAIRAARAGRHVLCEKPVALNHPHAMAMIEAAREQGVFFMEAFMYRCHPQTAKLVELVREGAIGQVHLIQAAFGFQAGINPEGRLFNKDLGGGGLLDVGCYPASMSRLIAGAALGQRFAEPRTVKAFGRLGETGVDEWTAAVVQFDHDIIAQLSTAVRVQLDPTLRIYGSEGQITVPNPWLANRKAGDPGRIIVQKQGQEPEQIDLPVDKTSFAFEADVCARAIGAGQTEAQAPAMSWADTLSNMRLLDAWRRELGLSYPAETPEQFDTPLHGGPLRRADEHAMQYGRIDGVDKPVSRFVMGCDNQPNFAHAAVMYDEWFERGGNAFDTAWIYGRGRQERDLGQWIKTRNVRDQVVIIAKGAHSPACDPVNLSKQLLESLDRLGVDFVDIYVMHRDNPDIPVDEFMDVLNEHHQAGRIGVFGGSNWTLDRVEKANDYASTHRKQPMSLVSNNLSLAAMVKPVWPGCVSCSDADSRKRLSQWQMPLLSWSSQARGYFLEESQRMKLGADNFACWDSPDNRKRRQRAEQLAKQLGVSAMNIAAAYVLNQPFPTFALIGPREIHEIPTAMPAMNIELTESQRRWLNLEVDSPA